MTIRIVIPVEDETGLDATVAQHFGRAPYFAVVELNEDGEVVNVKTKPNKGEHFGGIGHPHEKLLDLNPNAIVAYGMGPSGLITFQNSGAKVLKVAANTVKENIALYKEGKLAALTGGCEHAHHHPH
jgi:predicted Fe-Mo cluster-binding NifX family protein